MTGIANVTVSVVCPIIVLFASVAVVSCIVTSGIVVSGSGVVVGVVLGVVMVVDVGVVATDVV